MKQCLWLIAWAGVLVTTINQTVASSMDAMVKDVTGRASCALPGATAYKPLTKGMTLVSGSMIRTEFDGTVILIPVRGTALRIGPSTEITVSNMDFAVDGTKVTSRKADIELNSGVVTALLDESIPPEVTDFKIHTPQGVAVARGTFFAVCVDGDKSYVKVKSGKVGVRSNVNVTPSQAQTNGPAPAAG